MPIPGALTQEAILTLICVDPIDVPAGYTSGIRPACDAEDAREVGGEAEGGGRMRWIPGGGGRSHRGGSRGAVDEAATAVSVQESHLGGTPGKCGEKVQREERTGWGGGGSPLLR